MRLITIIQWMFFTLVTLIGISSATASETDVTKALGWVLNPETRCGGYYVEAPFTYPENLLKTNSIQISSDQLLYAQHGTSVGQGKVTITRYGQQIIANKAYLYRDTTTGELSAIELSDNVTLREPNSLVVANRGRYVIKTKAQSLHDILYRTTIYSDTFYKPAAVSNVELQKERKIYQLSAWGEAKSFSQEQPKIFEFEQASYSTCPPTSMAWQVRTSHLILDKESGRGLAKNARLLVRGVPVLYTPYLSFPLDSRRKTGFLWPTFGTINQYGPYFTLPFYWNLAPNFDTTITPGYLSKRGIQIADLFRYLSTTSYGNIHTEVLPNDRAFKAFKISNAEEFGPSDNPVTESELRRLEHASDTRGSLKWLDNTRFNDHLSADVNYSWVSDDYYLRDFSTSNINQTTQNQLLQQGDINYKSQNWDFTGRVQAYQTLHPVDEKVQFRNQYARTPQLVLNGDYPDQAGGFEYFISNEATRFDMAKNPGLDLKFPVGNRGNMQPGISRPITTPYLSVIPRLQYAMTQYDIGDVANNASKNPSRMLPIFDINTHLYFDRDIHWFKQPFRQTLEPQLYYTYIPYRDQNQLPVFDTTVNTLTYDQLFVYNRFSGLDRINDANQIALGLTTRFIDPQNGNEKVKAALGEIVYFRNRRVTLCSADDPLCPPGTNDYPGAQANRTNRSPLAGVLNYNVNENWAATANSIWNPQTNHLDNQSFLLHYQPLNTQKIVNLGYNFVRDGDTLPTDTPNSSTSNLSTTDLSFSWPALRDWSMIGRWTQNWNHHHFQNLLYGLQYDSCCWAVRMVTGRIFSGLSPANTFQYNTMFYMQVALKGLGSVGQDPSQLLGASISGYQNNFGRDF